MLMLNGLTDQPGPELVPMAKAWLAPAEMEVEGAGFKGEGFDPAQKAFVVARDAGAATARDVELTLRGTPDSPVLNPAVVVRNWGAAGAAIEIDGAPAAQGRDVRVGEIHRLDGDDLVVWLRKESSGPVRIAIRPAAR